MTDCIAEIRASLDEYVRQIDRRGHAIVTWTCPSCGAKHVHDHESANDAVECCVCKTTFALLPKQELARAIEAMPNDAPTAEDLEQRYRAIARSRRHWIDAATAALGAEWNGTPDDLRATLIQQRSALDAAQARVRELEAQVAAARAVAAAVAHDGGRYEGALQLIAAGNISPAITFARYVLDGMKPTEALRACALPLPEPGEVGHSPLRGMHQCAYCGKMTRDTTAGCDHCDVEDK